MRSGACQSIVLMLATGIGVNIMQKNIAHRKSLKQCVYGAVACPSRSRVYVSRYSLTTVTFPVITPWSVNRTIDPGKHGHAARVSDHLAFFNYTSSDWHLYFKIHFYRSRRMGDELGVQMSAFWFSHSPSTHDVQGHCDLASGRVYKIIFSKQTHYVTR